MNTQCILMNFPSNDNALLWENPHINKANQTMTYIKATHSMLLLNKC